MKKSLLFKTLLVLAALAIGTKVQAQNAYYVLSDDGKTLTFYYDLQGESRGGYF